MVITGAFYLILINTVFVLKRHICSWAGHVTAGHVMTVTDCQKDDPGVQGKYRWPEVQGKYRF